MANVKFTDLPDLGNITAATIVPVVDSNTNYTVTAANLQTYVNSTTGNVTAGNVTATGNVTAGNILANTNIQALANITAFQFIGNGSQLTGVVSSYGNANVEALLPTYTGNITATQISATGNITGNYFIGNGSQLTGLPSSYGNAEVAAYLPTYSGNLNPNTISATGNVTGAFLLGNISSATGGYGNANVQAVLQTYSGTLTAASISTTGNIAGNFFVGNGSQLTGITSSLLGTMTGNIAGNSFNITGLNTLGATTVSASGNVVGTHYGSGSNLTGIPISISAGTGISVNQSTGAITITNNNPTPYANANVAAYLPTYSGALTAASVSATGNVTGANITGTHFGNGASLSNIVTSITAGTGISVNASTGAVTITATGGGGGGTSIANGNSNVTIATVNGNITSAIGGWGNVMNIYNTAIYPIHRPKGFLFIDSTTGSYNNTYPFDGGIQTTGTCQFAGSVTIDNTGVVNGTWRASINTGLGATVGSLSSGGTIQMTGMGNIDAGGGGFKANQRTVAQGATGTEGQIFWDANYIYVCTATNTWKRELLSTY